MIGLTVNDVFPCLKGQTQKSDDFNLYSYLGEASWGLIVMYPCDFQPVSLDELGALARLQRQFSNRGVRICAFSCNDVESHRQWIEDIKAVTGAHVDFPIFSDFDGTYSTALGIVDKKSPYENGGSLAVQLLRAVYLVRPDKTIALAMAYPSETGRNFNEILREVDALQLSSKHFVSTPHNWNVGEKVIIDPSLTDEDADKKFHKSGYTTVEVPSERGRHVHRHYNRFTQDPTHPPSLLDSRAHRFTRCLMERDLKT